MEILGIDTIDFGANNVGDEINGRRPGIIISEIYKKDGTILVVPITSKKKGTKYRGGFTINQDVKLD